ncbi:hypothetical protein PC9H_007714 [Pleurotus ostreatus]|uniref:PinX1-related protein 1 n=1 Tax=Pleurotus ostreatus TaxID=5322 RepID=A0A8H6ZRT6_PLEOS|nr:uncharacterized protein PC9H_007714 [Pleurotus ostreatus]KAF7428490.1 hypothetical protein PC9H_007714 [Pleurotus ostreatus]KAJ8696641.1 hypothetical protein PTI98_006492 [Pleurotus ostreatus]
MGLSGRKEKQRIAADPRNLGWAGDAARFGSTYLSKFGWDPSKGLGATGEGRISHLKVAQKLDMLGIGAAQQNDVNGIAWKQNKDFEALLRRLNESTGEEAKGSVETVEMLEVKVEEDDYEIAGQAEKGRKKRKKGQDGEREESVEGAVEGSKKDKKRRKKDRDGGADGEDVDGNKEKKRRKKDKARGSDIELVAGTHANDIPDDDQLLSEPSSSTSVMPTPTARRPAMRHRAHRARAIASKSIASKSSAAIAEILGISPSASPSVTASVVQTPRAGSPEVTLEKLQTSTKSVSDYFKEKLLLKSTGSTSGPSALRVESTLKVEVDSWDETPRLGLGSSSFAASMTTEVVKTESNPGIGMSAFSRHLSSMFASATLSSEVPQQEESEAKLVEEPEPLPQESDPESTTKKSKSKKKRKGKEREAEDVSLVDEEVNGEPVTETLPAETKEKEEKKKKKRSQDSAEASLENESKSESKEERRRKKAEKSRETSSLEY